ncbi:ATP-binding protein [candidate division KSB1 bacterium]|nr:ATP-binding protein [candidate division KSB1 bacterium]
MPERRIGKIQISIPSVPDQIQVVEEKAEKLSRSAGFSDEDRDSMAIAVTEMIANAIYHGNKGDPKKKVTVTFYLYSDRICIHVRDYGGGFNPDKVADPLKPENLLKDSGRGIFIVRTLMDKVYFKFHKDGTTAVLVKYKTKKT